MLYVYYGADRQGVRDAATKFIEKKLPGDATLSTIESSSYEPGQITNALGARSLFGGEEWFLIDTPSDNTDLTEEVTAAMSEMKESSNTFIILEGPLLAAAKKKYTKEAESIDEFTAGKADRFNTFTMADALVNRDKRKLWVLVQEAKLNGIREEEIIGILWWQLKVLRLAASTQTAAEAGMKAFPYTKAKKALNKFQPNELHDLSHSLLKLYHEGHAGLVEIDLALEHWVLSS